MRIRMFVLKSLPESRKINLLVNVWFIAIEMLPGILTNGLGLTFERV
jgi:hypothetical protein